jgi:3-oxoacyl-[acyl-carrier protein] reductase
MQQPRHGRVIAIALAEAGVDVAVNHKENRSAADEVVGGDHEVPTARDHGADTKQVDLLIRAIASRDGEVNILVNCAAIAGHERLNDVDLTTFDEAINVKSRSAFLITAVEPAMPRDKLGRLIFISSMAADAGGVVGTH